MESKITRSFTRDEFTHLHLVVHDRVETLAGFIAERKAGPPTVMNARLLTKLENDLVNTRKLLSHILTEEPEIIQ